MATTAAPPAAPAPARESSVPVARDVALGAAAAAAGAAAGVAGTAAHQVVATGAGVRWPIGLLVALALLGCVAATARAASRGSVPTLLVAAAWLAVTGAGAAGGGGDVLIPDNWRGTGWLLGGAAVLVAVLVRGPGAKR